VRSRQIAVFFPADTIRPGGDFVLQRLPTKQTNFSLVPTYAFRGVITPLVSAFCCRSVLCLRSRGPLLVQVGLCSSQFMGLCCINLERARRTQPEWIAQATRPKSWFTRRISPVTLGIGNMQWPRRIMRMTSKPLMVAEAVFILWKPRVGRITRLRAP
jgi:hypothetical protein